MRQKDGEQKSITVKAAFRTEEDAYLVLYERGKERVVKEVPFVKSNYDGILRTACAAGIDPAAVEYNFRIGDKIVQDEKAKLIRGREHFGKESAHRSRIRCAFLTEDFDWGEDAPLRIPYEDAAAYYLHVRGYTMHPRSGVKNKGTFLGLTEKIPYLTDLGINQVILMPSYEFDEIVRRQAVGSGQAVGQPSSLQGDTGSAAKEEEKPKINYWGYAPSFYFAPKAGFAATEKPDIECKTMVKALHSAGMEVIMEFAFPDTLSVSFMEECLSWWVNEYHIDGFLLLAGEEYVRMLAASERLATVKLMSAYFDAARVYPKGRMLSGKVLAEVNDGFKWDCRRLLKGDENMLSAFVERQRKNDPDKAIVNYIAGHDGFTLMDLVSYERKHNEENGEQGRDGGACEYSWNCGMEGPSRKASIRALRLRQMKNAMAMVLLAQGTPMILAGDEFGNSQNGNNNPWCQDNETSWVDWSRAKAGEELRAFIRTLLDIRKAHPVLHKKTPLTGSDTTSCGYPDFSCHSSHAWYGEFEYQSRHIGLMYCDAGAEKKDFVYIAWNLHWEPQSFALPYLPDGMSWQVAADTSGEIDPASFPEREIKLEGRSVLVLTGGIRKDG